MSAPDQAFTKAYAREAASAPAATRQAIVRMRTLGAAPAGSPPPAPPKLEDLYADGALYRLEAPQAPVPPPHYSPPASQQRTVQRRSAGRYRAPLTPPADSAPSASEHPTPSRRMPVLGLNDIARRLAHSIPRAPAADLPPEVLVVEEPVVAVPALPLPSVNMAPSAPPAAAAAPQAAPIRPSEPPPVELPPLDDVATLVEVCTPWESINDAVTGSMVILTEPPAIASVGPSDIETALDAVKAQDGDSVNKAEAAPLATETSAAEVSAEKHFRVDPPQPQAHQPHFSPARNGRQELDLPPLAALTADETDSLLGNPPVAATATAQAQAAAATAHQPLVPMWEVDRFQWPSICDRLMKDEQSYFAQAGGKLVAAAKDGLKTLGITGSRRGEGRTTLALCLARSAAQAGLNVAMIDADFTRPQLAAVIGLEVAYGWQDAAQGKIPLPEAAVRSLADKITVLPLEPSSVAWPLALADKRVAGLIRAVATSHDLVIVDLGPLSGGSEPLFAADEAPPLDAVIVLRDLRYATPSETQAIGQRLHDSGIEAVGIAENFVAAEKART